MTEQDKIIWVDFKANVTNRLTPEYRKILCTLHANYYNGKIYKMWIADIDRIYDKQNS